MAITAFKSLINLTSIESESFSNNLHVIKSPHCKYLLICFCSNATVFLIGKLHVSFLLIKVKVKSPT